MSTERQSDLRLRAGSHIGPYRIQRLVNRGKTSAVYRAYTSQLNRDVALKIFHLTIPPSNDLNALFTQEVRAIAALKHPNLIRVYDFGSHRNAFYIVLEWITGTNLRDTLSSQPTGLDRENFERLFNEIASAVASAHDQNIVHGNIKPDNILLDISQRPILTDFTIRCMASLRQHTPLADQANSAAYVPPEQARGGPLTPACDIYALGVLLYEMATGTIPFQGKLMPAHPSGSMPVPPSQIRVELDPRVDQVVLKALSAQPADRYDSVREMLGDLQRSVTAGGGYDTVTLGRASAEQVRRSRSEIRSFERSRAMEKAPTVERGRYWSSAWPPLRSVWAAIGVVAVVVAIILLVLLWAA